MIKLKAIVKCDCPGCDNQCEVLVELDFSYGCSPDYDIYNYPDEWLETQSRSHWCPEHTKD
jgi:hypothetical protein